MFRSNTLGLLFWHIEHHHRHQNIEVINIPQFYTLRFYRLRLQQNNFTSALNNFVCVFDIQSNTYKCPKLHVQLTIASLCKLYEHNSTENSYCFCCCSVAIHLKTMFSFFIYAIKIHLYRFNLFILICITLHLWNPNTYI